MHKILSNRIILGSCLFLAACASSGPERRVNDGQGPVSARARNALAADNPQGLVNVAEGFERAGNLEGAYNLYAQAKAAAPDLLSAQLGIARIYAKSGRLEQSRAMMDGLGARHSSDPLYLMTYANILVMMADFQAAEDKLGQLITPEFADAEVLELAGRLAQVNGRPKRARDYFDRALGLQPSHTSALRNLALSFAIDGEYESAVALLQRTLDNPVEVGIGERALAFVYAMSGQKKAAMAIATSAANRGELEQLRLIFDLLPRMSPRDQAATLMFNYIPPSALKGTGEQ